MGLRLRQIALVAKALEPAVERLVRGLDVTVAHRDPSVARWGLENALLRIGHQFLEVVAPTRDGTAAGRYLERRGGDGGYMVILQCTDDHQARRAHFEALGLRTAFAWDGDGYRCHQLHPGDTGGSFLEVDHQAPDPLLADPWWPAGGDWEAAPPGRRVDAIAAAELQSPDPEALAAHWGRILQVEARSGPAGPELPLDEGCVRFVAARDGRGEGLAGLDLRSPDPDAAARGLREASGGVDALAGMRIRFVEGTA